MKRELEALINHLKTRNQERANAINDDGCSDYARTVLVSKYNTTVEIIKAIESIIY